MKYQELIEMFNNVFAPKSGEKILFLIDKPHGNIKDTNNWKARRVMANKWYKIFKLMGKEKGFSVDLLEYNATGMHNKLIPSSILDIASRVNLVIAMTEFSASSSLKTLRQEKNINIRCASMPGVEKRMEETAFKANYKDVKIYANSIKKLLNNAIGAKVAFSSGDELFLDLRNREASADGGDCSQSGQFINFPSGEGYVVPYEGTSDEIEKFGGSKTEGILPDNQHGDLIKYRVKNNTIIEVIGDGEEPDKMRTFFDENKSRRNIAELGIGCNPKAIVTGNILEDEKVGGLHIAYGMSKHLGGKIVSDMHQDICFPKGVPAAATSLTLINKDGSKINLIDNSTLRYDLLK